MEGRAVVKIKNILMEPYFFFFFGSTLKHA